jgi:hypothetical protein
MRRPKFHRVAIMYCYLGSRREQGLINVIDQGLSGCFHCPRSQRNRQIRYAETTKLFRTTNPLPVNLAFPPVALDFQPTRSVSLACLLRSRTS